MNYLKGFGIISICMFLGHICNYLISFPVPESVYGMVFLFIALILKIVKVEDVEPVGVLLLSGLALFFAPSGIALMTKFDSVKNIILPFVFILIITTFITMIVTAKTIDLVQKIRRKK